MKPNKTQQIQILKTRNAVLKDKLEKHKAIEKAQDEELHQLAEEINLFRTDTIEELARLNRIIAAYEKFVWG